MSFGVDAEIVPAYTYTASASVVSLMSVLPLSWWILRRTMSRWITIGTVVKCLIITQQVD